MTPGKIPKTPPSAQEGTNLGEVVQDRDHGNVVPVLLDHINPALLFGGLFVLLYSMTPILPDEPIPLCG